MTHIEPRWLTTATLVSVLFFPLAWPESTESQLVKWHIFNTRLLSELIVLNFRALAVTSQAQKMGYQLLLTLLGKSDRLKSTTGISELCPPLLNPMSLKFSFFDLDQVSIQTTLPQDQSLPLYFKVYKILNSKMRRPKVQVSSDDWVWFFYFIQRSALMIVPATDLIIQANFQGSMTLMLCFQEHANLIPLNKGYANLKSKFPVVIHSLSLKFFKTKLHSSVWEKKSSLYSKIFLTCNVLFLLSRFWV